ncbi:MAG: LPS-assembly protein LptD, partial [Selenomonadaceae bacterium]|nr:LPS-assembly protein LptD [Selenomonadaceae bacterium]
IGHWRANSVASTHQKYEIGLGRDPIIFHGWLLFLHTSYTITKESANRSTVRGMNYDAVLGKDFDQKWAGYFGYHFTKNNTKNSLFRYGLDDYSKKLMTGLSYRMDKLDRFVVGLSYDTDNMKLKDVDYYWYRDIHCSQLVLRYRAKRKQWQIGWQFIPW